MNTILSLENEITVGGFIVQLSAEGACPSLIKLGPTNSSLNVIFL